MNRFKEKQCVGIFLKSEIKRKFFRSQSTTHALFSWNIACRTVDRLQLRHNRATMTSRLIADSTAAWRHPVRTRKAMTTRKAQRRARVTSRAAWRGRRAAVSVRTAKLLRRSDGKTDEVERPSRRCNCTSSNARSTTRSIRTCSRARTSPTDWT